jgi:hypothetical protein
MNDSPYYQLDQLVNAYFHQDWSDDHDDEESVLASLVSGNWLDEVQLTIAQIDHYLAEHPVGLIESFNSDFSPMIIIGSNDAEAKAWLDRARSYLAQHLANAPVRNGTPGS